MSVEGFKFAEALASIGAAYWPLFAAAALLIVAAGGVCALLFAAQSVHGQADDDDNVVNFEKWRG